MGKLTTNVVPFIGPEDAKMCFVGEAPGAEEDAVLEPFIGQAGQAMNRWFRQTGIVRSKCRIGNVFEQRPPRNKVDYFFQDKAKKILTWEGQEHVEKLRTELTNLLRRREAGLGGPNVIVALRATALQVLTGKRRINKWRGSVLPCTLVPGLKVYPTLHPSFVNRLINETRERFMGKKKKDQQNVLPLFLIDLKRIQYQADFPEIKYPVREFTPMPSFDEIILRLKHYATQKVWSGKTISVDIETLRNKEGGGPIVWMIGFSHNPARAFSIHILKEFKSCWTLEQEAEIWYWVSRVFLRKDLIKLFQGGMYDLSVLGRYYGLRVADGTYADTMLCHHASYPYIRKGLEVLCSIYTWEPYYKDEGKVHAGKRISDLAEANYNCKDTSVTEEIFPVTQRNALELQTWAGYQRTISVIPSLLGMMLRGTLIDQEAKETLAVEFGDKARAYYDEVQDIVQMKTPVNIGSHDQVKRLLYGYYDLPIQYHHKTKKPTSDKAALQKLLKKCGGKPEERRVLECLLGFAKFNKLVTTYTSMKVDSDGRLHTSYGFVSTWRTASSESPFGSGGNLQNIPNPRKEEGKLVRSLFIPDPGYEMGEADYRQAEAMVVAWEAEDIALINAFLSGVDTHWKKAMEIFDIPGSVPYNPKALYKDFMTQEDHTLYALRQIGKIIRHAGNYGEGPVMLQTTLAQEGFHLPLAVCKRFIQQFKQRNPMTMDWQRRTREKIKATRTLISSYGRKREFMGRLNDNLYRAAYAFSPQNTVGELLEVATQRIWERLEPEGLQILLNSHDACIFQIPLGTREHFVPKIRECMEEELIINGRPLVIPVDFKFGPSWGGLKEVEGC
jgi:DNA polymerase I-like protein with 3'-5' exonuclease and polymerase domains/uracil-DNA glycosylase